MPYRKKIADLQESIDAALAKIAEARADNAKRGLSRRATTAEIDKMLVELARLKAERLRLMQKQSVISNRTRAATSRRA